MPSRLQPQLLGGEAEKSCDRRTGSIGSPSYFSSLVPSPGGYFATDVNILDELLERIWDPLDGVVFILIALSGLYWIFRVFAAKPGGEWAGVGETDARR